MFDFVPLKLTTHFCQTNFKFAEHFQPFLTITSSSSGDFLLMCLEVVTTILYLINLLDKIKSLQGHS